MGSVFWIIMSGIIVGLYVPAIIGFAQKRKYAVKLLMIAANITAAALLVSLLIYELKIENTYKQRIDYLEAALEAEQTETMAPTAEPTLEPTPQPTPILTPTQTPEPTPTETIAPFDVVVTSPCDGDAVEKTIKISGVVNGELPDDTYLWVVANPDTSDIQYWPQGKALSIEKDGSWNCIAQLGNDDSKGHTYYIYIVCVNTQDNQYYNDYLNNGRSTGDYPAIPLPPSAEKLVKVAVLRQ